MIYSRWRPDLGGYDYFETPETHNRNDDLPTPQLVPATKIGVPSIEAGRPIPAGAKHVGTGEAAIGLVAPVDQARIVRRTRSLAGIYQPPAAVVGMWVAGAAAAAALYYFVIVKKA